MKRLKFTEAQIANQPRPLMATRFSPLVRFAFAKLPRLLTMDR